MSTIRRAGSASPTITRSPWWLVAVLVGVSVAVLLVGQWLTLFVVGIALAAGGWTARRRASDPQVRAVATAVMCAGATMAILSLLALVVLYPTADPVLRLDAVHD